MKLRRWILPLVLIALVGCWVPAPIQAESFFDALSLSLEQDIGAQTYNQITAEKQVVTLSAHDQALLNNIFTKLANQSVRRNEIKYTISVVNDPTVNAFALPGGYVFVNTGLLKFAKNQGELAGILGHEIAHIDRRHSMQAITRQIGMTLLLQLALGGGSKSQRDQQIQVMGAIAISLGQLGYSREAEYQADLYGVRFMKAAGYNKQDLLNFWSRMQSQSAGKSSVPTFLSTHPPTTDRIKRIQAM